MCGMKLSGENDVYKIAITIKISEIRAATAKSPDSE